MKRDRRQFANCAELIAALPAAPAGYVLEHLQYAFGVVKDPLTAGHTLFWTIVPEISSVSLRLRPHHVSIHVGYLESADIGLPVYARYRMLTPTELLTVGTSDENV